MIQTMPPKLFEEIQKRLRTRSLIGEEGWYSGSDEEDTLTGDYCSSLRSSWKKRKFEKENWAWRITYKKFRSKGRDAEEKILGADGIVQLELINEQSKTLEAKGLLFQAKKTGNRDWAKLKEQCESMEKIAKNCSAVFEYGEEQYVSYSARQLILSTAIDRTRIRIGDYLADRFMACSVGKRGLYYDAVRHVLIVPHATSGVIQMRLRLKHRLKIEVRKQGKF